MHATTYLHTIVIPCEDGPEIERYFNRREDADAFLSELQPETTGAYRIVRSFPDAATKAAYIANCRIEDVD
jgi:hypothetical protein